MMRNVLFVAVFGLSAVFAEDATLYLEDRCDSIVHQSVDDTVTIRLARSSGNDRKNCQTKLILHTKDDAQLFVSFSEFQLAPAEDPTVCLQHFLQLEGLADEHQEHRLCDSPPLESLNHFLFSPEKLLEKSFYYSRTVPLQKNSSIVLSVSPVAFADRTGSCPNLVRAKSAVKDFRCESDDLCIPDFLRCDRIPNCRDGSDEHDCIGTTTTEPTTTSTSTVASLSPQKEIARGGERQSGSSKKPHIIIGTVGGVVILLVIAVIVLFLVRRSRRRYHNVTTTHVPETATENADSEEINTALRQPEDSTV